MADEKKSHIYNSVLTMWLSFIKRVGLWEFIMMIVRTFAAKSIIAKLPRKTLTFDGAELEYVYHKYNITWVTERVIEVPIGRHYVQKFGEANALEVGNVLGHYYQLRHTVLDKFEKGPSIVNADIVEYAPGREFDLILSISTFEHIGYEDDGPPNPEKIRAAIHACQKLLTQNGLLVITVPFGYNEYLDRYVAEGKIRPERAFFFEKVNNLDWKETTKEAALKRRYGRPHSYANGIMVAEFRKSTVT